MPADYWCIEVLLLPLRPESDPFDATVSTAMSTRMIDRRSVGGRSLRVVVRRFSSGQCVGSAFVGGPRCRVH